MYTTTDNALRALALSVVYVTTVFFINNILTFWFGWPGALATLSFIDGSLQWLGWLQLASYVLSLALAWWQAANSHHISYEVWSNRVSDWAALCIRTAFWLVLLVGIADALISFLRIENLLPYLLPEQITADLSKPQYRSTFVHLPLSLLAFIMAIRERGLGFTWLTLLVVVSEFMIVITRFVFSYEQAFMGDLVRFWYAALFLFASAHTLLVEGHIRVDVAYTHFSQRARAWVNTWGVICLGLPLCWTIVFFGMWDKTSSINSPLLSMEISQSGYGMYVKYLMVGFLAVFAYSMTIQFASYFLKNVGILRGEMIELETEAELPKLDSDTNLSPQTVPDGSA